MHRWAIKGVVFIMKVFTRSKLTVLNQLSAIREAIDYEQGFKSQNLSKIQALRSIFAECAEELAHMEIRKWRIENP